MPVRWEKASHSGKMNHGKMNVWKATRKMRMRVGRYSPPPLRRETLFEKYRLLICCERDAEI